MKCPKCQYIGFDDNARCRNCGYEFSLAVDTGDFDLPLKTGNEPLGPLSDFSLDQRDGPGAGSSTELSGGASMRPDAASAARGDRQGTPPELPLFGGRGRDDDAPLVTLPASPRAPVAVRKSNAGPRPPAARRAADEPELDLGVPPERPLGAPARRDDHPVPASEVEHAGGDATAPTGARLLAAAIDLVVVFTIDATVLYLTLKVCGLEPAEARIVPLVPFVAFLALLNGGYMAGLTAAGGQSLGKMVAGIKVVTSEPDAWTERVPLGQAVLRAVGYVVSALPVGLGFLPAFFGAERRGVHDRLAHTRVVKA